MLSLYKKQYLYHMIIIRALFVYLGKLDINELKLKYNQL